MNKTMKKASVCRLLLALALLALLLIGCAVTASADDLEWNLLTDKEAGYEIKKSANWVETTEEDGTLCLSNGNTGALYIYDTQNILGTYQTFSMEGDFYFDAFPTGLREDKYAPEDKPLSFICWNYNMKSGVAGPNNAIRLDSKGYIYTNTGSSSKTDLKLETGRWYNIRCVFTPKSGQCELYIDGEKELDYTIVAFDSSAHTSGSVRYFDAFFNWGAKMKNLIVKTDSDYVIGERVEEAADYIGYQTTKPEGGSFSIRSILGVNSTEFNRIGYEVMALEMDDDGNILTETVSNKAKVIYESVVDAAGNTYNIKELYGYNYAAAVEIPDLPEYPEYGMLELVVRPYVLGMNGIRLYGDATILVYGGDTDDEGYPVLDCRNDRFLKVYATDDTLTYSSIEYSATNFGTNDKLMIKNMDESNRAPERAAYFKFTLTPEQAKIMETAASAKLYVCVQNIESKEGKQLYDIIAHATGTAWTETTLMAKNSSQLAPAQEFIGQASVADDLYFSIDVTQYLREQMLNDDGSMTASFRLTTEGHEDALLVYLHSKESKLGLVPYIEIVTTMYEHPINIEKYGNDGYEPWGYAEYLVDEWFDELRDKIRPTDESGNPINYDIPDFDAVGYDATVATGDFTREMPWTGNEWSSSSANGYRVPVENWNANRFARTLSTLGTSTANAFLDSEYASQPAEYDIYGGITNAGFTGTATGFFHVETYNGRPYIIDPLGNPYFAIGINEVIIRGTQNQQDYVLDEFGSKESFIEEMTKSLKETGINTTFAGSDNEALLAVEGGLNCVISLEGVSAYMKTLGRSSLTADGLMPFNNTRCVFDPGFIKNANKVVSRAINQYGYADNPNVFGYTADNELPSEVNMLENYLTLDPKEENTNAFSYATAWTWLARRMNDPYPTLEKYKSSPEYDEINREFLGFWYARYYSVMNEAIKAVAPNQMYLGSRSNLNALTEEWIIRAAGYYTDMITANLYGGMNPSVDTIVNLYRYSGVPFVVTEFFAKAKDAIDANGYPLANSTGAGILVQTQQDRADYYEHYALALLESKACVGWTWYRFRDNDQSLFKQISTGNTLYMAYVMYGVEAGPVTFADKDGKVITTSEMGFYDKIYSGDGIASNQNVNKGLYNSNFNSVVTVYNYDKNGKLTDFMSYEVEDPASETPAEGTPLRALDGSATYKLGKVTNADGGYTETILTVYKGKYIAFANAIKAISSNVIGIVKYFDAQ